LSSLIRYRALEQQNSSENEEIDENEDDEDGKEDDGDLENNDGDEKVKDKTNINNIKVESTMDGKKRVNND